MKINKEQNSIIILLYGTSTSGKTTICKNLQNKLANIYVDSSDKAFKRLEVHNFEKIKMFINDNKVKFSDYIHIQKIFSDTDVLYCILNEAVKIKNKEISLMFDLDENNFENELVKIIVGISPIEKQAILTIRGLAKSYFDEVFTLVHKEMYHLAISQSLNKIPSILDIIPHPAKSGQFMIDLFQDQLRMSGHSSPTFVALIYCSIANLSTRMLERKRSANESNNLEDVRDKAFPFRQFSQLFGNIPNTNLSLGKISLVDAQKIIAPFTINLLETENIIKQLGFHNNEEVITIHPKCTFDQIYNADLLTSQKIAEKLYLKILENQPEN